jgi:hypothetical protein
MQRQLIGLLLVISLVILSGYELAEDLNLPEPAEVDGFPDASRSNTAPGLNASNNLIESADHRLLSYASLFDLPTIDLFHGGTVTRKKVFRLHKLNRVYLI